MTEKKTNVISIRVSEDLYAEFKAIQAELGMKPEFLIKLIIKLIKEFQASQQVTRSELIQQHLQALQELSTEQQEVIERHEEGNRRNFKLIEEQRVTIENKTAKIAELKKEMARIAEEDKEIKDYNEILQAGVKGYEETRAKLKILEDMYMKIQLNQDRDPYQGKDMFSDLDSNKTAAKTPRKKTVKKQN